MPAVSVIVPIYKAEAFLRKCADSILKQTFSYLELILVDDGSPDKSGAICDDIAAEDARVRVIHKKNAGVSEARNDGLNAAQGRFIAFVDSDDWIEPDMLETMYNAMLESGADCAACGNMNVVPGKDSFPEAAALPTGVYEHDEIMRCLVAPLVGDRAGSKMVNGFVWRYLYNADVIRQASLRFVLSYLEDELFLAEYLCVTKKLVVVDKAFYNYYWNPNSITHKYVPQFMKLFEAILEKKTEIVNKYGIDEYRPQWREETCFAGMIIAVSNEYAPGNPAPWRERKNAVKAICELPEIAHAIKTVHPVGQQRNKEIVTRLVRAKQYGLLTLLYRIKNG